MESQTSRSTTLRLATDYYTAGDTRGFLKGYQELNLGSNASLKPQQVIVDNITYDQDGRQNATQTVTADEELVGSIVRRFLDWLTPSNTNYLTSAGAMELASLSFRWRVVIHPKVSSQPGSGKI